MTNLDTLTRRLRDAGFPIESVQECTGGVVAVAGVATLRDGTEVFAKCLRDARTDVFRVEADGLAALRGIGGVRTPGVVHVSTSVLVLQRQWVQRDGESFWRQLGSMVAALHTSTVSDRFGWERDGWLGRMRQDNTWHSDGHSFFAERRLLRWLPEPLVEAALDREDRRALESLCASLPELVPPQPACLTHGDLWAENTLVDHEGFPVLIDPAVSYMWPEVDLSMMWCSPRPPASESFFEAYGESAQLRDGWRDRMRLLFLRELLSTIAHDDDDWGAAAVVREIISPFRQRHHRSAGATRRPTSQDEEPAKPTTRP